jgi:TonB family protein
MRKGKMTAAVVSLAMLYAMGSCGAHAKEQVPTLEVKSAREVMVAWRPPQYPYEARSRHIQGSGIFLLFINPKTGLVTKVRTLHSTGSPILDNAAISAFWFWGFKPNAGITKLRVPVTFVMGTKPPQVRTPADLAAKQIR